MTTNKPAVTTQTRPDLALVDVPYCDRPIPAFMLDLPWAGSDEEAINEILGRILDATSVDDVLDRPGMVEFETLKGHNVTVHGFRLRPGDREGGWGAYAVIDFTHQGAADHLVTTTGAQGVVTQLGKLYQLGQFPFSCQVVEVETSNAKHNNPLYLGQIKDEPF